MKHPSIHLSYSWSRKIFAFFQNQYLKHLSQIKTSFMIYKLTEKKIFEMSFKKERRREKNHEKVTIEVLDFFWESVHVEKQ